MTTTLTRPATAAPSRDGDSVRRPPRREQVALGGLLLGTALLYLWDLGINGYANEYYAAAVQAGSESWKAWFFGALDSSSAITVDKTPGSLWVMGLSARLFGFSGWSMLLPQALMGVASVAVLHASVRRWFGAAPAFVAGLVLALTPVAALMFRFDNPDALLVLLSVAAAYAVTRAIDTPRRALRWLVLAGVLVGLAFLAKMLQAFLVLPGFVATYAVSGRAGLGTRVLHLLAAAAAMVVAAGWWVLAVELWPLASRPYVGGSQGNSILELTLGYNGLGRLNGEETGSVGGGGGGGGAWGTPGLTRLLGSEMGTQIGWLLPAALVGVLVLLVLAGRAARTDRTRAFAVLWGGWLLVTGLTFSLMQGIIHSYYTVALAPAIGALVGVASVELWRRRDQLLARATLAGTAVLTVATAFSLLRIGGSPGWLGVLVLVVGLLGAALLVIGPAVAGRAGRRLAVAAAALVAVASLTGPATASVATVAQAHTGALPSASTWTTSAQGGAGATRGPGGGGGFLGGGGTSGVSAELVALLQEGDHTWAAAAVTANGAAPLQLASGEPVLAIGGFNGTDPYPDLAQFQQLVADGDVHYLVVSDGGGRGPGGGGDSAIQDWVAATFQATTVGAYTAYDLTSAA